MVRPDWTRRIARLRGLALVGYLATLAAAFGGWGFDTGLSPEATRDLLAGPASTQAPAGSWLRVRELSRSMVRDESGAEIVPWKGAEPTASVAERRAALRALRERGYQLIAIIQWPTRSWAGGTRADQPLRRLPLDLREAADRARRLAEAYGDLIDYWEVENEPDISFVEENPETYAAFLKACYLGFTGGATADGAKITPAAHPGSGRVLAAAFGLPPGPYFDAWLANDGLRYTDGFNYHYYGYAEDFTGVYRQFETAVARAPPSAPANTTVFQTRFYPAPADWRARQVQRFATIARGDEQNRAWLQDRPRAAEEPVLTENGRWLVAPGTTVRETGDGWEFAIAASAPGPLRPAMAELPLSADWKTGENTSLAFEYRALMEKSGAETKKHAEATATPASVLAWAAAPAGRARPAIDYAADAVPPAPAVAGERKLPVFLTEYGYGLLGKTERGTSRGREAQRAWFAAVRSDIRQLGVEGAMAFVLKPYLEADLNEFGLLVPAAGEGTGSRDLAELKPQVRGFDFSPYRASPALVEMLREQPAPAAKTWTASTADPAPVVIDFVADDGLERVKTLSGYRLRAATGTGRLVLYNYGREPVSGELRLKGDSWTLASGRPGAVLRLEPNERREIAVDIRLAETGRFAGQTATAVFTQRALQSGEVPEVGNVAGPERGKANPPVISTPVVAGPDQPGAPFEVYVRTANGNLYQTWPRLTARESWQWYVEPFASFTPAFFGRAHLPAALNENQPVALVFFFRPENYPARYQIRHASVAGFERKPAEAGR